MCKKLPWIITSLLQRKISYTVNCETIYLRAKMPLSVTIFIHLNPNLMYSNKEITNMLKFMK